MCNLYLFINKHFKILNYNNYNLIKMSGLTFISSCHFAMDIEALKEIVITTLVRWMHGTQRGALPLWLSKAGTDSFVLEFDCLLFRLIPVDENDYLLSMNAIGNYRRHGSSCDYFDRLFDCLVVQIGRPDTVFANMNDCLAIAYPPILLDHFQNQRVYTHVSSALPVVGAFAEQVMYSDDDEASLEDGLEDDLQVEDLEDDSSSEEDVLEAEDLAVELCDMSDVQIDEYIESLGREPREELEEWTMDYQGGQIIRYSYVNFANAYLSEEKVSDVVIRNARFTGAILQNYVFDNVEFYDCTFYGMIEHCVIFMNCTFTECDLSRETFASCIMENNTIQNYSE